MLDLVWSAEFNDRSVINQYDDPLTQIEEHTFQEVKDRFSDLTKFSLHNIKSGRDYEVDLIQGKIHIWKSMFSCIPEPEEEVAGSPIYDYRLIYFRRITRQLAWVPGAPIEEQGIPDIQYFLGFQYNDETGRNIKKLLQITSVDEVYFA